MNDDTNTDATELSPVTVKAKRPDFDFGAALRKVDEIGRKQAGVYEQMGAGAAPIRQKIQDTAQAATQLAVPQQKPAPEPPDLKPRQMSAAATIGILAVAALVGKRAGWDGTAAVRALGAAYDAFGKQDQVRAQRELQNYNNQVNKFAEESKQAQDAYRNIIEKNKNDLNALNAELDAYMASFYPELQKYSSELATVHQKADLADKLQNKQIKVAELALKTKEVNAKLMGMGGGQGADPRVDQLMAAFAERNISLPVGARSVAAQQRVYKALIDNNPGLTPAQIADNVRSGKLDLTAQSAYVSGAGRQAGRIATAENELLQFIPLAREQIAKVPRTSFVPINQLLNLSEEQLSNPEQRKLKSYVTSVLNAYDQLAARGGTDKAKRAEVRGLLTTADSPKAFAAALEAIDNEAKAAGKAARAAMKFREEEEGEDALSAAPSGGQPQPAPQNASQRVAGQAYMTPKGVLTWTGTGWLKN